MENSQAELTCVHWIIALLAIKPTSDTANKKANILSKRNISNNNSQ